MTEEAAQALRFFIQMAQSPSVGDFQCKINLSDNVQFAAEVKKQAEHLVRGLAESAFEGVVASRTITDKLEELRQAILGLKR